VVAAGAAILSAKRAPTLLVDLAGGVDAVLGVGLPEAGLVEWFESPEASPDALARLETVVSDNLSVLSVGGGDVGRVGHGLLDQQVEILARVLEFDKRLVVVDLGRGVVPYRPILARASQSILVVRACYLALSGVESGVLPDVAVVVREPARVLTTADIERALECPVVATLPWDPAVARSVDAGLLLRRVPHSLDKLHCLIQ